MIRRCQRKKREKKGKKKEKEKEGREEEEETSKLHRAGVNLTTYQCMVPKKNLSCNLVKTSLRFDEPSFIQC